jgi:hypothetical protein
MLPNLSTGRGEAGAGGRDGDIFNLVEYWRQTHFKADTTPAHSLPLPSLEQSWPG